MDVAAPWDPVPGYLNAAAAGLPPRVVTEVLAADVDRWRSGQASPPGYDAVVDRARRAFARLVRTDVGRVAVGPQVSVFVALVAATVPDRGRVVVPAGEFTSVLFPFLVHADRGVVVEQVPAERLAEAVRPGVDVVAYSLVQSSDGTIIDAAAIGAAARDVGAMVLADLTQAAGWLPVRADDVDVTVTGAYKWLCAPRGSAFMTVGDAASARLRPLLAGWYAGADPWGSVYGPRMELADDARRFDVSPAWPVWVGTAPAVELFADLLGSTDAATVAAATGHGGALADLVRRELGIEPNGRPVLARPDPDGARAAALTSAGCVVSSRAGGVRLAFHLWNDEDDVDRVVEAFRR